MSSFNPIKFTKIHFVKPCSTELSKIKRCLISFSISFCLFATLSCFLKDKCQQEAQGQRNNLIRRCNQLNVSFETINLYSTCLCQRFSSTQIELYSKKQFVSFQIWYERVGVNCSKFDCSTIICSTLLAGNQLLDTKFINCSNPVELG